MCINYSLHKHHVEDFDGEWVLTIAWVTESLCLLLEGKHEPIISLRFQWYALFIIFVWCMHCASLSWDVSHVSFCTSRFAILLTCSYVDLHHSFLTWVGSFQTFYMVGHILLGVCCWESVIFAVCYNAPQLSTSQAACGEPWWRVGANNCMRHWVFVPEAQRQAWTNNYVSIPVVFTMHANGHVCWSRRFLFWRRPTPVLGLCDLSRSMQSVYILRCSTVSLIDKSEVHSAHSDFTLSYTVACMLETSAIILRILTRNGALHRPTNSENSLMHPGGIGAAYASFKRKDDLGVSTIVKVVPGRLLMGLIECNIRIVVSDVPCQGEFAGSSETRKPSRNTIGFLVCPTLE